MIGHPAPLWQRGVRRSNHDRSLESKRWLGRTEFLTPTIRSGPKVGKRKPFDKSEMALFRECIQSCAYIVLDFADIVRDGDFSPTTIRSPAITNFSAKSC